MLCAFAGLVSKCQHVTQHSVFCHPPFFSIALGIFVIFVFCHPPFFSLALGIGNIFADIFNTMALISFSPSSHLSFSFFISPPPAPFVQQWECQSTLAPSFCHLASVFVFTDARPDFAVVLNVFVFVFVFVTLLLYSFSSPLGHCIALSFLLL